MRIAYLRAALGVVIALGCLCSTGCQSFHAWRDAWAGNDLLEEDFTPMRFGRPPRNGEYDKGLPVAPAGMQSSAPVGTSVRQADPSQSTKKNVMAAPSASMLESKDDIAVSQSIERLKERLSSHNQEQSATARRASIRRLPPTCKRPGLSLPRELTPGSDSKQPFMIPGANCSVAGASGRLSRTATARGIWVGGD